MVGKDMREFENSHRDVGSVGPSKLAYSFNEIFGVAFY